MDGTLLNKQHKISKENKQMLNLANNLGVKIAISTGRNFSVVNIYSELLGFEPIMICSNGAYVKYKNEVIFSSYIPRETLKEVYNIIKEKNFLIQLDTKDTIISEVKLPEDDSHKMINTWANRKEKIKFDVSSDLIKSFDKYDICKVIIMEQEGSSKLKDIEKCLEKVQGINVVYSWGGCAEIVYGNTSKGTAVKLISDLFNINKSEVMCIGDSANDISMLNEAGLAVAMGNANKKLHKYANYITDTNEYNGVAKAVEKFVVTDRIKDYIYDALIKMIKDKELFKLT